MFGRFLRCEQAAVTIDWVALTAGILLIGITLVYALFNDGVASVAGNINETLNDAGVVIDNGPAPGPGTFE